MQTYIIRFKHPQHGDVFAEEIGGTESDARESFQQRSPDCDITGSHCKPVKTWV